MFKIAKKSAESDRSQRVVLSGLVLHLSDLVCLQGVLEFDRTYGDAAFMRTIKFYVYKEAPYYVSQCLNVDVSSFGDTIEESIRNLKETVELHFDDIKEDDYRLVKEVLVSEGLVNAEAATLLSHGDTQALNLTDPRR